MLMVWVCVFVRSRLTSANFVSPGVPRPGLPAVRSSEKLYSTSHAAHGICPMLQLLAAASAASPIEGFAYLIRRGTPDSPFQRRCLVGLRQVSG
jgi:hypothetical protein